MRLVLRTIGGAAPVLAVTALAAMAAAAPLAIAQTTQPPPPPVVSVKPASGPAGSGFTIAWSSYPACRVISFVWAGTTVLTSQTAPKSSGQVSVSVPADATPGSYQVAGNCASQKVTATTTFRVTGIPPVTNPPVTNPPVTNPPVTNPPITRPPVITPNNPSVVTTPPSTPPPSDVPPPPPSTVDTPGGTTGEPSSIGDLVLDRPAINPGDPLSAAGTGCSPNAPVTLMSKGERVGGAAADDTGNFVAPVEFTRIEAGRHVITASCGVVLTGSVDQLVTSSTGGQSSTLVILVFFVLAGVALIRFS
ncbi:MAG: hypothetical protein ABW215_15940 [Kibdelosporangium sp.]